MKLTLQLHVDSVHNQGSVSIEIPEFIEERFKTVATVSEPILGMFEDIQSLTYENTHETKVREDAAEYLATHLSDMVLKLMCSRDKHDGFIIK